MRVCKRWLAFLLTIGMLLSALPMMALAEERPPTKEMSDTSDEVIYNLWTEEITVGWEEDRALDDPAYALFDKDGSYVITLDEENPVFPYEVQFIVNGTTTTEWFDTPEDTVTVGGHTFRMAISGDYTRIAFQIGGDEVVAYPEAKQFTNFSTYSMLPLERKSFTLNLSNYLPWELKEIPVSVLNGELTSNGESGSIAVWAKYGYYDEDGNYISKNDDYMRLGDATTIDLSNNYFHYANTYLELIVGTADQLNNSNLRYTVMVNLMTISDLLKWTAYSAEDTRASVTYDQGFTEYRNNSGAIKQGYYLQVDKKSWTDWKSGKMYLGMALNTAHSGLTVTVYEGYYETEDAITAASATDITAQIYNQQNLATEGGYLYDDSKTNEITVVLQRSGKTGVVLPLKLSVGAQGPQLQYWDSYLYKKDGASRIQVSSSVTMNWVNQQASYKLHDGYVVDGQYYLNLSMKVMGQNVVNCGISYVDKAVVGKYDTVDAIPTNATDIKAQLFSDASGNGGYLADYSQGVTFTIVDTYGEIHHYTAQTVEYKDVNPLSRDTYFEMNSAYAAKGDSSTQYETYVMPYSSDSYFDNGYQTIFLWQENKGSFSAVSDSKIYPVFSTGREVNIFAGHKGVSGTKQLSGETEVAFESGKAIHYSAAAEDQTHLKNYWVTFLTQQSGGAKLFVNGATNSEHRDENNVPIREIVLNETYGNHHDIFFANIGDTALQGLSVTLEDAENITLDPYWTVGTTTTLAPFDEDIKTPYGGGNINYSGEARNVGKIRLLAADTEQFGFISGTLKISSANGGTETIKLTGVIGTPKITTTSVVDGVKYVPYSSVIQTNNMYHDDAIAFQLVDGKLPTGVSILPDGEIYGVPQEFGTFTFTVKAVYQHTVTGQPSQNKELADTATFTLTILDNTNENVWKKTSTGYEVTEYIGTMGTDVGDFTLDTYQTDVFWSNGELGYFVDFWLDGKKLIKNVDYLAEDGSTKITIYQQTFQNAGEGTHTIAAEFRENGELKTADQNYTIKLAWTPPQYPNIPNIPNTPNTPNTPSIPGISNKDDQPDSSDKTEQPEEPANTVETIFHDVQKDGWYYSDVSWAYEKGLMRGMGDDTFAPETMISMPMVVVTLARLSDADMTAYTDAVHSDVPAGQWYTEAAAWAKHSKLLGEELFSIEPPYARGKFAVILVNYLKFVGVDVSLPENLVEFSDSDEMTEEEYTAFQILHHYGIFNGVGDGAMQPQGATTRAQLAALLHRLSVFVENFQ